MSARILLTGYCRDFPEEINLINVYGPCNSKDIFWDRVLVEGTLELSNLLIVGDLNVTWSTCVIWGRIQKWILYVITLWI